MPDAEAQPPEVRRAELRPESAVRCVPRRRRRTSSSPRRRRRSSSSCTTRISSGAIAKKRASGGDRPARTDSCTSTASEAQVAGAFATSPANLRLAARTTRRASARARRRTRSPRCAACARTRGPGLPSPATRRMGAMASRRDGEVVKMCPSVDAAAPQRKRPAGIARRALLPKAATVCAYFFLSSFLSFLLLVLLLAVLLVAAFASPAGAAPAPPRGGRCGGLASRQRLPSASSTCAFGTTAVATTGSSLPRVTTVTPAGSLSAETWIEWPTSSSDRSTVDELRQVLRQARDVELGQSRG